MRNLSEFRFVVGCDSLGIDSCNIDGCAQRVGGLDRINPQRGLKVCQVRGEQKQLVGPLVAGFADEDWLHLNELALGALVRVGAGARIFPALPLEPINSDVRALLFQVWIVTEVDLAHIVRPVDDSSVNILR